VKYLATFIAEQEIMRLSLLATKT